MAQPHPDHIGGWRRDQLGAAGSWDNGVTRDPDLIGEMIQALEPNSHITS
jgi:hypothetical protein